jgi:hypothetical protein
MEVYQVSEPNLVGMIVVMIVMFMYIFALIWNRSLFKGGSILKGMLIFCAISFYFLLLLLQMKLSNFNKAFYSDFVIPEGIAAFAIMMWIVGMKLPKD